MKVDTKTLLIGVGLYLLLSNKNTSATTLPSAPTQSFTYQNSSSSNAQAWQQWVNTILSIYGNVSELWEPGGLFYNHRQDVIDATGVQPPGIYDDVYYQGYA